MQEHKTLMNIVIIGHSGSGTTTLTRRLTCQRRFADQKHMEKDIFSSFETTRHRISIQPRPQHRDFIQSCFSPPIKVDCVLLVVSAALNEFETSIRRGGEICEHLILTLPWNIKTVIVAVNKMDTTDPAYSEERFHQIKTEVSHLLEKVGYRSKPVSFVPISCHDDENLFDVSKRMSWYHEKSIKCGQEISDGKTLLQVLDAIVLPLQSIQKPLRLPVKDVFHIGHFGTIVMGRVETGILRKDMLVNFTPSSILAKVISIEKDEKQVDQAVPGDNIGFQISGTDVRVIQRGNVCSDAQNHPALATTSFLAKISVLNGSNEIKPGYKVVLACHTVEAHGQFISLLRKVDRRTGQMIELSPTSIKLGDTAVVKLVTEKFICIETFADYPTLGRIAIRDLHTTIAVGTVEEVEKIPVSFDQHPSATVQSID